MILRNSRAKRLASAVLGTAITAYAPAQVINVSDRSSEQRTLQVVSVSTNQAVLISVTNGFAGAFLFTHIDSAGSSFRWRFRDADSLYIGEGAGRVKEPDFSSVPLHPSFPAPVASDPATMVGMKPVRTLPRHDELTLPIGKIVVKWSWGSSTNLWLYYNTNIASLRFYDAGEFNRLLRASGEGNKD
jgi:hypothetical protein